MDRFRRIGFSAKLTLVALASALTVLPAVAQDKTLLPIRIAATPAAVSLPQWIAMKEQIFQEYDLAPQETIYNVNFQGLLAIGAQQGDVSIQSDIPTISSLAKGIDAVIVAVMARFTGGCKLVAPKSIRSINDLMGKKVAWPKGTGCEYGLVAISKAKKFDISRFIHVDLPPAEGIPLLIKGDLGGTFYWEPWPRIALKNGRGRLHVLANSDGFYDSLMFLTVRRSFAERNPAAVQNLLRALGDARRVLQDNPEKGIAVFRDRMRVDEKTAKESLGDYAFTLTLDSHAASTAKDVAEWLKSTGKIEKLPDWNAAFDAKYLRAVDPDAVRGFPW